MVGGIEAKEGTPFGAFESSLEQKLYRSAFGIELDAVTP
jgi:uncharacterized protein YheU (UPF0270 family)